MIYRALDSPNNLEDVVMACPPEETDNFQGIAIDVPDCFSPSQTGLGVYLPAGSQTPTAPSLSASLPNTPGSWTSQGAISVEASHLRDAQSNTWNQFSDDDPPLPDTMVEWDEPNFFTLQEESEIHCCAQGSPFPESADLTSALLPSQPTPISSSYPHTSDCYRSEVHESTPYYDVKINQGDDLFDNFQRFGISSSNSTTREEVFSRSPAASSLVVNPFGLEANPVCQFTSSTPITSSNTHRSNDLPSSGKVGRMNSLPAGCQAHEDLYERAKQSVERVRKRRRTGTPVRADYVCHICGRPFSRNYNLQIHLPTHTPDRQKQWTCTWTGCDKVFTRRTDLVRHEKCVHTRDKIHRCVACGFSSSRKDTLRRHVEDGCQKRKIQGKKMAGKDRSSVVKLRAKPAPPNIEMSVPPTFTSMDRSLNPSNFGNIHHNTIHDITQGLG